MNHWRTWLWAVAVACLIEPARGQTISNSVCVAIDHSQVNCSGVTFKIGIDTPAAQRFVLNYLEGRVERLRSELVRSDGTAKLQQRIQQLSQSWLSAQPILAEVRLLQREFEARGLLDAKREREQNEQLELLKDKLDVLLSLRQRTDALEQRFRELEQHLRNLEASEGNRYTPWRHRLQPELLYAYQGLPSGPNLHLVGGGIAYRAPGTLLAAVGFRLFFARDAGNRADLTGGGPSRVTLGTIDPVQVKGGAAEVFLQLGWEWRWWSLYADGAVRYLALDYVPTGLASHDWHGPQYALGPGVRFRLWNRLSVDTSPGLVLTPRQQPLRYEFGINPTEVSPATSSDSAITFRISAAVNYVIDL